MAKDPTEFRNRFKLYKEGKMPYENGLPKYAEGTEGWLPDYTMDYILALENPTKLGLVDGIWRPPTDSSKWDVNAIGGGLDIRYKNNPLVYNFLSDNNRLSNPYLTEQEEYDLRRRTFNDTMLPALIRMHDKYGELISSKGYARLAGMKWLGHPFLMAITPDSITGRAFLNAIESGDRDLDTVFDAYYRHPANAKKYAARIQSDENYWSNNHSINLDDVPIQSTLRPIVEKRDAVTVRKTIPKAKTRARWTGAENVSPYLTGKPILKLKKEIKFPTAAEMHKESLWKAPMLFKDGKLPEYANGKIYIKPENRGKFTALKKRTGHSASWFKENGTPAQKKMATFALNAKKWHHADGKLPEYGNGKEGNKAKTLINALLHPFLFLRDRMYSTVPPSGYETDRVVNFITGEKKREYFDPNTEAAYGLYTKQDSINTLEYGPFFRQNNIPYRVVGENQYGDPILRVAVKDIMKPSLSLSGAYEFIYPNLPGQYPIAPKGKVGNSAWLHGHALGGYTKGTSKDENGIYDYYSDTWDINPFKGQSAVDDGSDLFKVGNKIGLGYFDDIIPWGNPIKIYGKVYQK